AFLYAGVTTVLDLGSLSPAVFQEREHLATGARLGPHLYAAGPIFTAPGGHPAEVLRAWLPWYLRGYVLARATREVATPDEARRAVAALLPERPDVLKLAIDAGASDVPRLAPETIAAARCRHGGVPARGRGGPRRAPAERREAAGGRRPRSRRERRLQRGRLPRRGAPSRAREARRSGPHARRGVARGDLGERALPRG